MTDIVEKAIPLGESETRRARQALENIYRAAPAVRLLRLKPKAAPTLNERKQPLGKWRESQPPINTIMEWLIKGERIGISPATARTIVLDHDDGGQATYDAAVKAHGPPLDYTPSLSLALGLKPAPRGHLIYPYDIETEPAPTNGKWAGGDIRSTGYVIIPDIPTLERWATAIGLSNYRLRPSIDISAIPMNTPRRGPAVTLEFDPADIPALDPLPVPDKPIEGLRKATLQLVLREARAATSIENAAARGERIVKWAWECRAIQAQAGWLTGAREGTKEAFYELAGFVRTDIIAKFQENERKDESNRKRLAGIFKRRKPTPEPEDICAGYDRAVARADAGIKGSELIPPLRKTQ